MRQPKKTDCTMIQNRLWLLLLAFCAAMALHAQRNRNVYVPKAGTLSEMIPHAENDSITCLRLQGKLNATDFRYLRDSLPKLRLLDLSKATIGFYAGKNGTWNGFHVYTANVLPAYAFCQQMEDSTFQGKESLHHVILPQGVKMVDRAAFKGCSHLHICQLRRHKAPRLQPEALTDSVTSIFVPEGSGDTYRSNEEWKKFAIAEGKPSSAYIRITRLGSLASELQRKGKQPKDIHFLVIEGKLDEADFTLIRDYMPNLMSIDMRRTNATAIPEYTFTQKKNLLRVILPQNLKSIGQRAFSGCTRMCDNLILPPSVTAIEFGAFMGCENLKSVIVTGNNLTTLGEQLFGEGKGKLVYAP